MEQVEKARKIGKIEVKHNYQVSIGTSFFRRRLNEIFYEMFPIDITNIILGYVDNRFSPFNF